MNDESNCECLSKCIVKRIEDIGRARECLKLILDEDIFEDTSKHNPYWHSDHEKESEKLYDLRMKISFLDAKLWDLMSVLSNDE